MAKKTTPENETKKPKGKGRLFLLLLLVVILAVFLLRRGSKGNGEKKA
jgi:hypothetical protein